MTLSRFTTTVGVLAAAGVTVGALVAHGAKPPAGNATAGKRVFATAGCTACHTLKAAGSKGTVGPNLDKAKPAYALIVTRVTNGKGPMPPFKGQLTAKQIKDVAAYVYVSTHK